MKHRAEVKSETLWSHVHPTLVLAAKTALLHGDAENGDLTIVLTDREEIQALNQSFAGEDKPTDVLSFIDCTLDPDSGRMYFGDVIIAMDIAQQQAQQAGHSLSAELCLLVIHGVLHLIGYSHSDAEDKKTMWSAQQQILDQLGVGLAEMRMDQ